MEKTPLTHEDQIAILEEIARDTDAYPRDRIAAIRALREMSDGKPPAQTGFDELDRVRTKRARA